MKEYTITSWEDFWSLFDKLMNLLIYNNQLDIVSDFKNAQKYVNGFTDGWYEFKIAFERVIQVHIEDLTEEQLNIAILLRDCLISKFPDNVSD